MAVWEPFELIKFRAVADQDDWAAAWRLTLCGLRRSEVMGLRWDAVDLDRGEIMVQAGRVLLDGHRTAIDDPKSSASHRTVPVEEMHTGTVALLRTLRARQAADRLVLGAGYPETGYVLVNSLGTPIRPGYLLGPIRGAVPYGRGSRRAAPQCATHVGSDMHRANRHRPTRRPSWVTAWRSTCPPMSRSPRRAHGPPRAGSEPAIARVV